jgi:dolichol-phosphate mannosyltransferase
VYILKKKFSIIIPILNEKKNIPILVDRIKNSLNKFNYEIIFVDDNSKDGSDKILYLLSKKNSNLKYLIRKGKKKDLSQSCLEGIKKATSEIIIIMDGDLQHDPKNIKNMIYELHKDNNLNLIIAVRNFKKRVLGMSLFRVSFSRFLILFISIFFGKKTLDPMSGFFLIKKDFFLKNYKEYFLKGYKILADILYNSKSKIYSKDIIIQFQKRVHGKSKMNLKILSILIYFLIKNKLKKIFSYLI